MGQDQERQAVLCQIANAAMAVASDLLEEDQSFAPSLRGPGTQSLQIYREEFITAKIAVAMKKQFSAHVDFQLFTTAEESKNGADWYWRIQVGDFAMHARVQAKRIARRSVSKPDEAGFVEIESNQIVKLIDSSREAWAELPHLQSWIATYARVNATPPCHKNPAKCRQHGCGGLCAQSKNLPSIWVAQASAFARGNPIRRQIPIQDIIHDSIRLDCMLPCVQQQGGSGPNSKGFALLAELRSFNDAVSVILGNDAMARDIAGALDIRI